MPSTWGAAIEFTVSLETKCGCLWPLEMVEGVVQVGLQ